MMRVTASAELLAHMVAALIERVPSAPRIEVSESPLGLPGVAVHMLPAGRWLYVAISPEPGREAAQALAHGAAAVLSLASTYPDLEQALETLGNGGNVFVAPEVLRWMAAESIGRSAPEPSEGTLTAREREVLSLVAAGGANHEIAAQLGITVSTVRSHLQALGMKLKASNRALMVRNARSLGFLC